MTFKEIIDSEIPVLVDFTASWCGPCQVQAPILEQVKSELGDKAKIIKVDVDKNQEAAAHFQVSGVPTLMIFKKGEVLYRQSGVHDKNTLINLLKQHQ